MRSARYASYSAPPPPANRQVRRRCPPHPGRQQGHHRAECISRRHRTTRDLNTSFAADFATNLHQAVLRSVEASSTFAGGTSDIDGARAKVVQHPVVANALNGLISMRATTANQLRHHQVHVDFLGETPSPGRPVPRLRETNLPRPNQGRRHQPGRQTEQPVHLVNQSQPTAKLSIEVSFADESSAASQQPNRTI